MSDLARQIDQLKQEVDQYRAGLERLASKESFTGAFDVRYVDTAIVWAELQARGRYAEDVLCWRVRSDDRNDLVRQLTEARKALEVELEHLHRRQQAAVSDEAKIAYGRAALFITSLHATLIREDQ